MRKFRDIPIKQKVSFITLLTSCVAILISSAIFISGDWVTSRRGLAVEVSTIAEIVGRNSAAAILFDDEAAARDILSALDTKPNIVSGFIMLPDSEIFAAYIRVREQGAEKSPEPTSEGQAQDMLTLPGPEYQKALFFEDLMEVAEPIVVDGEVIGHVILRSDLAYIYDQMRFQLAVATVATILALLIAVVLSSRLQKVITQPITHLVEVMKSVASNKSYANRARKHGDDELGMLIDGFNSMLEEIAANEDSLAARIRAETANRAKSEFLANMSHELRTPLNAIIGFSEILVREEFGPLGTRRYHSYVEDIHYSGNHLLNIINDILDLSKAEAGKLSLDESEVSLEGVIRQCLRMLDARAGEQGVKIETHFPAQMPRLHGDARLVSQVLINLLTNAVKFTHPGGSVVVTVGGEADGGCLVQIEDSGIGIAPQDLPEIRKPFAQVANAFSRNHEGTGLGLPLVDQIMKLHGGSLGIESELGKGTIVRIRFPAARVVAPPDRRQAKREALSSRSRKAVSPYAVATLERATREL